MKSYEWMNLAVLPEEMITLGKWKQLDFLVKEWVKKILPTLTL